MLLLDYARSLGVAMGSLHVGRHVGWTTDEAKADKLREAGANLAHYVSQDPRYSGWEVSFAEGREVTTDAG